MTEFFEQNIITVYFFYGLSFFSMGLAIMLEVGHASQLDFAQALRPLAAFGLVHGSHEWVEMFLLIHGHITGETTFAWVGPLRVILLAASFMMLLAFGARLIAGPTRARLKWGLMLAVVCIWGAGLVWVMLTQSSRTHATIAADVYTRYSLAIPGAALTAWGLILQQRKFYAAGMKTFGRDVTLAAVAFALYGGIGQLFASPSTIFPSVYLNADAFVHWFGFPIQAFRGAMACMAAVFIILSMRVFAEETRRQIGGLREAQAAEKRRLEALRGELLHLTVKAQESERQRIARELHDEIGQTLTALGMGLSGISENTTTNPQKAIRQAAHLKSLVNDGLLSLKNLVTGLHPPQLDELGLLAALRWYASEMQNRFGVKVTVENQGTAIEMSEESKMVLYRITQEAITNIVRHSGADQATIQLTYCENSVKLIVKDNGQGFDCDEILSKKSDQPCWGLLGMIERAELVGGECEIRSSSQQGTSVEVSVPVKPGG